jgi:hypothetical protein
MLALPVNAFAGHHHDGDDDPPPHAWQSQGWHRGWVKHHHQFGLRQIEDEDDDGPHCHFRPSERPPAYLCDDEGDDCQPSPGAWDDEDYGPLSYYRQTPPASYNLAQQRDWLIEHRRRAYHALTLMRARHDRRAADRLINVIHELDGRIARDNELLAGNRYAWPPLIPNYSTDANPNRYYSAPPNVGYSNYGYNPGYEYNPLHGPNPGYGSNTNLPMAPGLNALTSMVGPLLGYPVR